MDRFPPLSPEDNSPYVSPRNSMTPSTDLNLPAINGLHVLPQRRLLLPPIHNLGQTIHLCGSKNSDL